MSTISREYFRSILEQFLDENHPELPDREKLLENRSERALQTYCELSEKGTDRSVALEAAIGELTGGFGFSLFQFIYGLVCDDFSEEITDETRRDFCIAILPECRKTAERLSYEDMDEWEARYRFEEKMTEIIQNQIFLLHRPFQIAVPGDFFRQRQ